MLEENFARQFTAAMDCHGLALGQALTQSVGPLLGDRQLVLDIDGDPVIYANTLVAAHPHLRAMVLDQSPVDALGRTAIKSHGVSDRVEAVRANMFTDPWPTADIHLLSNVLHNWDIPELRTLLQRSADSLAPGGLVIIHEVFINDDKTGTTAVTNYSALLMQVTQGKCYTSREYGTIMTKVGLKPGPYRSTLGDRG